METGQSLNGRPLRLLIFGASITAYRGSLDIAAFQVSDWLNARGVAHVFFNSGVPGNTTAMARDRFERDVLGLYPDIVFISFGTNDSALDVHRGQTTPRVTKDVYAENLRFFARELNKRDVRTVFYTIPPLYMTDRLREIYGHPPYTEKGFNFMADEYVAIMKQIAGEENIPCLDVNRKFWLAAGDEYENLPEFFLDGMHPNRAGQAIIAGEIMDLLDRHPELLVKRSACADKVRHLPVELPAVNASYPAERLPFKLLTPSAIARVQYRGKPHGGAPANFGEWGDAGFTAADGMVAGTITGLPPATYGFQFRVLDAQDEIIALGGVDKVGLKT